MTHQISRRSTLAALAAVCVTGAQAQPSSWPSKPVRLVVAFAPGGTVIARFFFIADPDGYQIEVLQRAGRYL